MNYLKENKSHGTPYSVYEYSMICYDKCLKLLDVYSKRKSNYNLNQNIYIKTSDYDISDKTISDFNVSDIEILFSISSSDSYKRTYGSGYANTMSHTKHRNYRKKDNQQSYKTKNGLKISFGVHIMIPKNKSSDISYIKTQIKETIIHEIMHLYRSFKYNKFQKNDSMAEFYFFSDIKKYFDEKYGNGKTGILWNKTIYLYNFFHLIYNTNIEELYSIIASSDNVDNFIGFENKDIGSIYNNLKKFNKYKSYLNISTEIEENGWDELETTFGDVIYDVMKKSYKELKIDMPSKYNKLKGSSLKSVIDFFTLQFENTKKWILKKMGKKIIK